MYAKIILVAEKGFSAPILSSSLLPALSFQFLAASSRQPHSSQKEQQALSQTVNGFPRKVYSLG
jgi:hypothetical protein